MDKQETMGKIVAVLSIAVLLYAIFNIHSWSWAIGSLLIGVLGAYIGWGR